MNLILADAHEFDGRTLIVDDHRAKHIVKILGCKEGDRVKCGEIDGRRGTGKIVSMRKKYPFRVELTVELQEIPGNDPNIDLLLALPRPIMLKRIFSQVTSLGVGKIIIINANRVEKSFWEAGLLSRDAYREHLIHGLEQAVDTRLPKVEIHRRFRPFMEDEFPTIKEEYTHLLLAHPGERNTLSQRITSKPIRVLYGVGPEGGWVDYEIDKFKENGFKTFAIGERILKVDTATIALHARISTLMEAFF